MAKLDWDNDRRRQLAKRAATEEWEQNNCYGAARQRRKLGAAELRASNLAIYNEIANYHQAVVKSRNPRGAWTIACDGCDLEFKAEAVLSTALTTPISCPTCGHGHQLVQDDLIPPWEG